MSTTELGTPSPRSALSRLRRNKGLANSSTNSLASSAGNGDDEAEDNASGLRASMEAAIDKLKDRTRKVSTDERPGPDSTVKRLSSLIPRKKRSSRPNALNLERSMSATRSASDDGGQAIPSNRSESSLVSASGHSSLLTDDNSDLEGRPVRPTLSPHQSHAGYLTLSSPELNTHTQPVASVESALQPISEPPAPDPSVIVPSIVEPSSDTEPFPALTESISTEASSAGTEKEAFQIPRKQLGANSEGGKRILSGASGLAGLFRPKSRRNSVNLPNTDAQIPNDGTIAEKSVADLVQPSSAETTVDGAAGLGTTAAQTEGKFERPETPKRGRQRINTRSLPATPPNLVDTPTTLVTPPTPTDPPADSSTFPSQPPPTSDPQPPPVERPLSSVESIKRRRAQSGNQPSKLSQAISAPLTPTLEETKTPGGTLTQPTNATSFFSFFSNVRDQFANNIGTQTKGKPDPTQSSVQTASAEVNSGQGDKSEVPLQGPAISTLGKGNLSLNLFGVTGTPNTNQTMSGVDLSKQGQSTENGDLNQKAEEDAAARAVSVAYEKPVQNLIGQATGRPLSIASNERLALNSDGSSPGSATDAEALKRSGSVRSKLSGRGRRHRASSATTGTQFTGGTIAAAIQSSSAALSNPGANGPGHRLTGFAVASNKRNKEFHQLFRSVPEDDYLIESYSAALQRDILLHGTLYVSEGHICFSSNILGWVTNLIISYDEIVSVEKKSTAVIFPNAIVISTLHARNTFASFVARDSTYELIIGIWKISHPNLKSSLNGVALDDAGTGDKTEVAEPDGSDDESGDGSDDEVYDEDEDGDAGSLAESAKGISVDGSDVGDTELRRKASAQPVNGAPQTNGVATKVVEAIDSAVAAASATATTTSDLAGPATHLPTECGDSAEHYDRPLTDTTIAAPLGKVYSLMFGPASGSFMRKWLVEDQKSRELNLDEKAMLDNDHKSMTFDYIKPLNAPVGPRQTKCITTNTLIALDLEKAVSVDCTTQTPDVPSGNVFVTKTRYCLMWGPNNSTRLVANCTVEWSGKSWLKGPIEKGANDGQIEYCKSLVAALRGALTSKPPAKAVGKKGKTRSRRGTVDASAVAAQREATVPADQKEADWGLFEPLHKLLGPFIAIIRPFVTSQVIIAVLFVLLAYTWILPPYPRSGRGVGFPGYSSPERLAVYEEIWRREESELWDWLEDRAGLDNLYASSPVQRDRQRSLGARSMAGKLADERMTERQMNDAVKVTEEKLAALKDALEKKQAAKPPKVEKAKVQDQVS